MRLLKGNAICGLADQHQPNQLLKHRMPLYLHLKLLVLDLVHDFLLRKVLLGHLERKVAGAQLVYSNANAPDIAPADFLHLDALEDLWCHILRGACEGDALLGVDNLRGQSEVGNLDLVVLDEYVGGFDVAMHEVLGGEVVAGRNDLLCECKDLLLISFEEVLLDVFLEIGLAILKEKVEVVGGLLDIEELDDVGVLEALQGLVFLLHALHEIGQIGLQHLLDVLLLDHLARAGLLVILVLVGLVGRRKAASAQALVHLYVVIPYSLVLLFHSNNISQNSTATGVLPQACKISGQCSENRVVNEWESGQKSAG